MMLQKFKDIKHHILYSFPVRLFILHLQQHIYLNLIWLLLFLIVFGNLGKNYGIPLLLLDPEFLGKVNFMSFFVIGLSMGGFIMTWNVCMYILDSNKFDFLVSVSKPFTRFVFNNTIIPVAFSVSYFIRIFIFQNTQGSFSTIHILFHILGIISGNLLMIIIYSIYFIFFAEDAKSFIGKLSEKTKIKLEKQNIKFTLFDLKNECPSEQKRRIESYFHYPWQINKVINIPIYDKSLIDEVYYLHHRNIYVIIVISLSLLILLGILMDYSKFCFPAGAAIFLLITVFSVLVTLFYFWFREWLTIAIILVLFILNLLTKYDLIVYKHKLYGLDYSKKVEYNYNAIEAQVIGDTIYADKLHTENILNNWKKENAESSQPKLVILNISGGGSKAAYWTFHILQELNKATNQRLFKRTVLISGASGGMYGAAYYRELYLEHQQNKNIHIEDSIYLDNIGKDMLNFITTSLVTNDIFYPFRKFDYSTFTYNKDRAYYFDKEFNANTDNILNKKLTEYKIPEERGKIPMMVLGSTIINDQRMLYISAQPISYLLKPYVKSNKNVNQQLITDAIEFSRFFRSIGAENINFISALRANATYPYILPSVNLPTNPSIKTMDAGFRDNYGFLVTARYLNTFQDWIEENTSGVLVITIRAGESIRDSSKQLNNSYLGELLSPIGGIYANMFKLQGYNSDQYFSTIHNDYKAAIDFIDFIYKPAQNKRSASLSWHLTNQEKQDIRNSFKNSYNQEMKEKLVELLY